MSENTNTNSTWTTAVDDSGEVKHEPDIDSKTTNTGDCRIFSATDDDESVLNRGMTMSDFCMTMSRLEIFDSKSYEAWFQEVGRWNEFPEFPAIHFGVDRIWREVRITSGYLKLLKAIDQPLSAFD